LPILAFSDNLRTVRELTLVWGVRSHYLPEILELPLEDRATKAITVALEAKYLGRSDTKVCVLTPSANSPDAAYMVGVFDIQKLRDQGLITAM
jgi:pyruvate kinase